MPRKTKPYKISDYKDHDKTLIWIYRKIKHDDYEPYFEFKKIYKENWYSITKSQKYWKIYQPGVSDIWEGESLTGYPLV